MSEDTEEAPTGNNQKSHFESIHEEYVADYDDRFSSHYKKRLIYSYLAREINKKFSPQSESLKSRADQEQT